MDLNKLKEFLPVTTVLLVIFYVSSFFVKLGEMFYFGYPFSLLRFSFTDALLYSVRTIPLIMFCLIAGLLIDNILSRYKKPKKILTTLTCAIVFLVFMIILILIIFNDFMSMKQILVFIYYYQIIHWIAVGIIITGFTHFLLPESEIHEKNIIQALTTWFVINFTLITFLVFLPIQHIIFTIFVSFSITLNVLKNFKFTIENSLYQEKDTL